MASVTPRRSARIKEMVPTPTASPSSTSSSTITPEKRPYQRWPFQPTSIETILLAVYPATLVLGSLFALIDPSTRASPYSAVLQAHPAELAPSYFAKKSNVFNQIFVKRGWFWITASFFGFLFTHPSAGPTLVLTPKRIRGTVRWLIVTSWWILVTQWCFGPALIDRGFTLTGGACELVRAADEGKIEMDDTKQFVTGIACKAVGGKWKGGHDISGHVFLLVLGSMFLFEEVLNVIVRLSNNPEERTIVMSDGAIKSADAEASITKTSSSELKAKYDWGVKAVLGVGGLSLWMLLMTAAYFHTWFEKFTGLLVAFAGIFVVYFLPRGVPALREVVGMPGI